MKITAREGARPGSAVAGDQPRHSRLATRATSAASAAGHVRRRPRPPAGRRRNATAAASPPAPSCRPRSGRSGDVGDDAQAPAAPREHERRAARAPPTPSPGGRPKPRRRRHEHRLRPAVPGSECETCTRSGTMRVRLDAGARSAAPPPWRPRTAGRRGATSRCSPGADVPPAHAAQPRARRRARGDARTRRAPKGVRPDRSSALRGPPATPSAAGAAFASSGWWQAARWPSRVRHERRLVGRADLGRVAAAGMEAAAGRRRDRARHVAAQHDPLAPRARRRGRAPAPPRAAPRCRDAPAAC